MLDTLYIENVEQADALLKPKRVEILRQLAEPTTCTQIGRLLGETPQAMYYHVKRLQAARLVELVDERRVRGITEGVYRAVARSFWVSPGVVGRLGPQRAREEMLGLGYLLDLREEMARTCPRSPRDSSRCPRSGSPATSTSRRRTARRSSPSCSGRSARCSSVRRRRGPHLPARPRLLSAPDLSHLRGERFGATWM